MFDLDEMARVDEALARLNDQPVETADEDLAE